MGRQQLITILSVVGLLFAVSFASAQPPKLTQQAIQRYQAGDLMAARSSIIEALQNPKNQSDAYTWYVKGFIFKEIYKDIDKESASSENREIATEAILKSLDLSASGRQAEHQENAERALRYLAISYYNDAVVATRSLSEATFDLPERYYQRYKALNTRLEPEKDYSSQDAEFFKNMARGCRQIFDRDPEQNMVYFERSNDYYRKAIALQPDDFQANYNLAVNYYNHGVHKIRKIDHNTEIFELIRIQEECVQLFKRALPYMNAAHRIQPEHRKTLGGLMAIYRSLSDNEKATAYQEQLESLIRKGSTKD
jgi:tetratricopeptide (TPR) repeat protein